ncbi:hypothetical protein GSS88_00115 [Corynebacterium sp. 3HC-13]|uniref:hypothetical protein n=1 Tax=Corynebacterium poyangense TaxID=2684405 RepID=UPI001CCF253D|nr:hypothetical protein [Corynebacterium poyangense]MBZ8176214.1 hypothetical protein [Corynebacterium poyangense]
MTRKDRAMMRLWSKPTRDEGRVCTPLKSVSLTQVRSVRGFDFGMMTSRRFQHITVMGATGAEVSFPQLCQDLSDDELLETVMISTRSGDDQAVISATFHHGEKKERKDTQEGLTARAKKVDAVIDQVDHQNLDFSPFNKKDVIDHVAGLWGSTSLTWPPRSEDVGIFSDRIYVSGKWSVCLEVDLITDPDLGEVCDNIIRDDDSGQWRFSQLYRPSINNDEAGQNIGLLMATAEDKTRCDDLIQILCSDVLDAFHRLRVHRVIGRQETLLATSMGVGVFPWQHTVIDQVK